MAIDKEKFLDWVNSRFDDIKVVGNEVKLNSIFCDDFKHHLWCNAGGGKNKRDFGVYHCWKTGKKGTLISLVMQVDQCSFEDALESLNGQDNSLAKLEKRLQDFFDAKEQAPEPKASKISLPPFTHRICDLEEDDYFRSNAEAYLSNRKIPTKGLMVCVSGDYVNRIIIPYYDKDGVLIFYNGRYLGDSKNTLRYLAPPKEIGVGKGDVVFVPNWPKAGSKIYLAEGEFDAISICESDLCGGGLGGKNISEAQANMLMDYIPVLCLDNDGSGKTALPARGDFLKSRGFKKVYYVRPPETYKDWNEMLVKLGPKIIKAYITDKEKEYDAWTGDSLRYQAFNI